MKKTAIFAIAASVLGAHPAFADTPRTTATGTIKISGTIPARCVVAPGNGKTFTDNVNFGELARADGTLRTDLATSFGTRSFTVKCNAGAPKISVNADPLKSAATAVSGYANTINYTAAVSLRLTGTNRGPFTNASDAAAGSAQSAGSPLANLANNVQITTSGYRTANANDLLVAANDYKGKITVVIAPDC